MAESPTGRLYARALFNVARHRKRVADFGAGLRLLASAVSEREDFRIFLGAPTVPRQAKEKAVAAVAEVLKLPGEVGKLFQLVVKKRRVLDLPALAREYDILEAAYSGRVDVLVESAVMLEPELKSELERVLKKLLERETRVEYRREPDLMAGLMVRAGGNVYDCSLAGRLRRLEENMLNPAAGV
jgi:F-type H+-transporting ATPase subunit delta